jgi:hypothetical protein
MRSCTWYTCLCAILVLVASPAMFANTWTVEDGDDYVIGDGYANGWADSCVAVAYANGDCPYSYACAYGSVDIYTDTAGYFTFYSTVSADAHAEYTDNDGSGGSSSAGAGGTAASGSGISVNASITSPGMVGSDSDDEEDPGFSETWSNVYLNAYESAGSLCGCGAEASAPEGGPNWTSSVGHGNADVHL